MVLGAAVATRPRVAGEHARIEGAGGQWHGSSVVSSWRGVCGGGEARHGGGHIRTTLLRRQRYGGSGKVAWQAAQNGARRG